MRPRSNWCKKLKWALGIYLHVLKIIFTLFQIYIVLQESLSLRKNVCIFSDLLSHTLYQTIMWFILYWEKKKEELRGVVYFTVINFRELNIDLNT